MFDCMSSRNGLSNKESGMLDKLSSWNEKRTTSKAPGSPPHGEAHTKYNAFIPIVWVAVKELPSNSLTATQSLFYRFVKALALWASSPAFRAKTVGVNVGT